MERICLLSIYRETTRFPYSYPKIQNIKRKKTHVLLFAKAAAAAADTNAAPSTAPTPNDFVSIFSHHPRERGLLKIS
jgi:hypothetical protein